MKHYTYLQFIWTKLLYRIPSDQLGLLFRHYWYSSMGGQGLTPSLPCSSPCWSTPASSLLLLIQARCWCWTYHIVHQISKAHSHRYVDKQMLFFNLLISLLHIAWSCWRSGFFFICSLLAKGRQHNDRFNPYSSISIIGIHWSRWGSFNCAR